MKKRWGAQDSAESAAAATMKEDESSQGGDQEAVSEEEEDDDDALQGKEKEVMSSKPRGEAVTFNEVKVAEAKAMQMKSSKEGDGKRRSVGQQPLQRSSSSKSLVTPLKPSRGPGSDAASMVEKSAMGSEERALASAAHTAAT